MTTIILQCKMKATLNRKRKRGGHTMKKRNTAAFTFLAWTAFITALLAMFIGIYTLDASLPVKGYYAVGTLYLTMSAFVLQKTIRDNEEDTAHDRKYDKAEEEL